MEDLQEETKVSPEKFVTEEMFDDWKQKDRHVLQASLKNEPDGRHKLEKHLLGNRGEIGSS